MSNILEITPFRDNKSFADLRVQAYRDAFVCRGEDAAPFLFAIYSLELLRQIQRNLTTPIHAYAYARMYHNIEKTSDKHEWNKCLSQYQPEIESNVATHVVTMIHDLAMAIQICPPSTLSAGLPIDMYNLIKRCEKKFEGYISYPIHETIELSLKHLDITETDKTSREHKFTMAEVQDMFSEFLMECVRPVRDEKDLMERSSKKAIKYFTTGLAIIYRLFSRESEQYWYLWDQLYDRRFTRNSYSTDYVSTVPVRTPEFVIGLSGKEKFSRKSLEAPVEINGVADRYLYLLYNQI